MAKIAWLVWPYHDTEKPEFHTEWPGDWNFKVQQICYFEIAE